MTAFIYFFFLGFSSWLRMSLTGDWFVAGWFVPVVGGALVALRVPVKRSPKPLIVPPLLPPRLSTTPPIVLNAVPARATLLMSVFGSPTVPFIVRKSGSLAYTSLVGVLAGTRLSFSATPRPRET